MTTRRHPRQPRHPRRPQQPDQPRRSFRTRIRRSLAVLATVATGLLAVPASARAGALASTVLAPQASPSGFPPGVAIYDTVHVAQAVNPTGTLTFRLYPPSDPTCAGKAIFTTTEPVQGNDNYSSDSYIPKQAGTFRWIVSYGGDSQNSAATTACDDPAQAVSMGKKTPTLNTVASSASGGKLTDTATLGNGAGLAGPTGTITFTLYGPNNAICAGTPIFTSTRTVAGNGTYTSDAFRPAATGTYAWVSRYGGDADNFSAQTICSDPVQSVTVTALIGKAPADFAGDGRSDVAIFRPSTGAWYVQGDPPVMTAWGAADDLPVPADYDGNGTTDIATYRPSTSTWYVKGGQTVVWGTLGDIPVPGDYDGDGTTEIAVYRPALGMWYVYGGPTVVWGLIGDIPVPGDYDGDGTTDMALYRPSSGTWYVRGSATVVWGRSGDIPVPGDYDGNGTTDLAVYRPSTGLWYLRTPSPSSAYWGQAGDMPVPGDYDGNGTTDLAVYRSSTGMWYLYGTESTTVRWGVAGDLPLTLPAAVRQLFF